MQLDIHWNFLRCAWSKLCIIQVSCTVSTQPRALLSVTHVQLVVNSLIITFVLGTLHTQTAKDSMQRLISSTGETQMERGGRGRHGRVSTNAPDHWRRRKTLKNSAARLVSAIQRAFGECFSLTLRFTLMEGVRGSFNSSNTGHQFSQRTPQHTQTASASKQRQSWGNSLCQSVHPKSNHAHSQSSVRPWHVPTRP